MSNSLSEHNDSKYVQFALRPTFRYRVIRNNFKRSLTFAFDSKFELGQSVVKVIPQITRLITGIPKCILLSRCTSFCDPSRRWLTLMVQSEKNMIFGIPVVRRVICGITCKNRSKFKCLPHDFFLTFCLGSLVTKYWRQGKLSIFGIFVPRQTCILL